MIEKCLEQKYEVSHSILKPTFISCLFIVQEKTSKQTIIIAMCLIVGLFDAPFEASFGDL